MASAFITNIAFPKSLEEVLLFVNEVGRYHVEEILTESNTEWTAPKDAVKGETVFFMHSKTSIDTIRRLKRQLQSEGFDSRPDAYDTIADALDRGEELYRRIGGCVFAKGVVSGDVIVDENARNSGLHWSSIYYAPISNIEVFNKPVSINQFREFIFISRTGAITKLTDEQTAKLLELARQA